MLISIDVGGTLGSGSGETLTSRLLAESPLAYAEKVTLVRETLHTVSHVTSSLLDDLCRELRIEPRMITMNVSVSPFELYDHTVEALARMRSIAPLVTLANVTSLESRPYELAPLVGEYVGRYFRSCDLGFAKPDRRVFEAVATACGISIESLVHVGDDWECDVEGALDAGARAIWISRGKPTPVGRRYSGEVPVAATLVDVASILQDLEGRTSS
jgi:FMN hydrolase / 5-amino-6-(5-phospho-D-ribitylamino)uracil phosphatase